MTERVLQLAIEGEYFQAILDGEKREEYRQRNVDWTRRLEGKEFDRLVLTLGYPSKTDRKRRIEMPWVGVTKKSLTHPHFGEDVVQVFAIKIAPQDQWYHNPALAREKA